MGQKTYQRILVCNDCGEIPEDGSPMWEMCGSFICEECIDAKENKDEEE